MKTLTLLLLLALQCSIVFGQDTRTDSLDKLISSATTDTAKVNLRLKKMQVFLNVNIDSSIAQGLEILEMARRINYYPGEKDARMQLATGYIYKADFKSGQAQLDYLGHFIKPIKDSADFGILYGRYGLMYSNQNKLDTSILFYAKAIDILERTTDTLSLITNYINIAVSYYQQSNFPMALLYNQKILETAEKIHDEADQAYAYINMAIVYSDMGDSVRAEKNFIHAADVGKKNGMKNIEVYACSNLATFYIEKKEWKKAYEFGMKAAALGGELRDQGIVASSYTKAAMAIANLGKMDSAIMLSDKAIAAANASGDPLRRSNVYAIRAAILKMQRRWQEAITFYEKGLSIIGKGDSYVQSYIDYYRDLSECYEKTGKYAPALEAFKTSVTIADSVRSRNNIQKATELNMTYEFEKKQQLQRAEQKAKDEIQSTKQVALLTALGLMLALAIVAFVGYRNKQKANVMLGKQKEEIEHTLTKLKSAQAQLIQSEKMASLGELTAGIAHEIQNPINFVNNFSELNAELINDMRTEISKGNLEEIKLIADDIEANEQKINHHGKRADAIVKGMLQHSQGSTGHKELTNINALADQYLRLSCQSIKTAGTNFDVTLQTNFDATIDKINVVPQDIGKVLLNLYNNAFYTVNEKKITAGESYRPTVSVTTKNLGDHVEICVMDNGNGIPHKILDKIFQPFFTTKPTGQGTGLGLSLSYDIIKATGGELKVQTEEGEGSVFTILLFNQPVS